MPRVVMCDKPKIPEASSSPAPRTHKHSPFAVRSVSGMIRSKVAGGASMDEELDGSFTIVDLKALVADVHQIPIEEMRVLHKGRALHDNDTLDSCGASPPLRAVLFSVFMVLNLTRVARLVLAQA